MKLICTVRRLVAIMYMLHPFVIRPDPIQTTESPILMCSTFLLSTASDRPWVIK